ncbi:hypothetical protein TGVAND_255170 [Toxoplasma gondii VAND]|uniref:RAP domain-containing protein n=1 Tax=Toxoplasma gondii VAND TaxID=933077 RepID=A0A086PRI6_TOXGO|nr:hypothetical protein TGVAND_255170 [Toxoplasma gondii VAND]
MRGAQLSSSLLYRGIRESCCLELRPPRHCQPHLSHYGFLHVRHFSSLTATIKGDHNDKEPQTDQGERGQQQVPPVRSALVREARRACVQRNSLVDMYQAAEKVQDGLARGEVSAGDAATLLSLFAKKKFVYKPFWRSVGKSILPLLPQVDTKGLALILNAFANAGVVDRRLLKEAADLIVLGNSRAQQRRNTHRLQGSSTGACDLSSVEAEESLPPGSKTRKNSCSLCGDEETLGSTLPNRSALRALGQIHGASENDEARSSEHGPLSQGVPDTGNARRNKEGVEAFLVPSALNARLKRSEMSVSAKSSHPAELNACGTTAKEGITRLLSVGAATPLHEGGSNSPLALVSAKAPLEPGDSNQISLHHGEESLEDTSVDDTRKVGTVRALRCQELHRAEVELKAAEMDRPSAKMGERGNFQEDEQDSIFTALCPDNIRTPSKESIEPQQGRVGKEAGLSCKETNLFCSVLHPTSLSKPASYDCVGETTTNIGGQIQHEAAGKCTRQDAVISDHQEHGKTALVKRMNAQDMALVVNAFAKLGVNNRQLYAALADNLPTVLSEASALQLVTFFASYSKVGIHDFSVYRAISGELLRARADIAKANQPGSACLPPKVAALDASAVAVLLNCIQKANFDNPHLTRCLLTHLGESRSSMKVKRHNVEPRCKATGHALDGRGSTEVDIEGVSRQPVENQRSQNLCPLQQTRSAISDSEGRAHPSTSGAAHASGAPHTEPSRVLGMAQDISNFRLYHDLGPREVSLTLNALTRLPHPKSLRSAIVAHASKLLSSMNDTDVLITTKALIRLHSKLGQPDAENLFLQIRSRFRAHGCGVRELATLAPALQRLVTLAPQLKNPAKSLLQEIAPRVANRLYKLDNRSLVQLASAIVNLHASEENTTQEILVEISRRLPDLMLDEKIATLHVVHILSRNGVSVAGDIAPFLVRSILDTIEESKDDRPSKWGAAGAKTVVTAAAELRNASSSLMERLLLAVWPTVPLMSVGQRLSVALSLLSCCSPVAHTAGGRSIWKTLIGSLVYHQARANAQGHQDTDFSKCQRVLPSASSDYRNSRHADASDAVIAQGTSWDYEDQGPFRETRSLEGGVEFGAGRLNGAEPASGACEQSTDKCFHMPLSTVVLGWFLLVANASNTGRPYESGVSPLESFIPNTEWKSLEGSTKATARTDVLEALRRFTEASKETWLAPVRASRCHKVWNIALSSAVTECLLQSFRCNMPVLRVSAADKAALEMYFGQSIVGEIQMTLFVVASEMWQAKVNDCILKEGRILRLKETLGTSSGDAMKVPGGEHIGDALRMLLEGELQRWSSQTYCRRFSCVSEETPQCLPYEDKAFATCFNGDSPPSCPAIYSFPVVGPFVVTAIVDLPYRSTQS